MIMRRGLKNKKGYTLVELLVVMAIISLLLVLSFSGYIVMRRQVYVNHLADQLRSDVRDAFTQSISVKEEVGTGNCAGKTPKVRAFKIPASNDFSEYYLDSYCEDSSTGYLVKDRTTIKPSDQVGFKEKVQSKATDKTGNQQQAGFNVITFSAPYGEGYVFYYNTSLSSDPTVKDAFDTDLNIGGPISASAKWEKRVDGAYLPQNSNADPFTADGYIYFSLASDNNIKQKLRFTPSGLVNSIN